MDGPPAERETSSAVELVSSMLGLFVTTNTASVSRSSLKRGWSPPGIVTPAALGSSRLSSDNSLHCTACKGMQVKVRGRFLGSSSSRSVPDGSGNAFILPGYCVRDEGLDDRRVQPLLMIVLSARGCAPNLTRLGVKERSLDRCSVRTPGICPGWARASGPGPAPLIRCGRVSGLSTEQFVQDRVDGHLRSVPVSRSLVVPPGVYFFANDRTYRRQSSPSGLPLQSIALWSLVTQTTQSSLVVRPPSRWRNRTRTPQAAGLSGGELPTPFLGIFGMAAYSGSSTRTGIRGTRRGFGRTPAPRRCRGSTRSRTRSRTGIQGQTIVAWPTPA